MTTATLIPPSNEEPWTQQQTMLILSGPIASGKSTFAEHLEQHFPQFRRCNQDDLENRHRVERVARDCLSRGLSIQRSHWIKIAGEFPGTVIWVIVFDTPYEVVPPDYEQERRTPPLQAPH